MGIIHTESFDATIGAFSGGVGLGLDKWDLVETSIRAGTSGRHGTGLGATTGGHFRARKTFVGDEAGDAHATFIVQWAKNLASNSTEKELAAVGGDSIGDDGTAAFTTHVTLTAQTTSGTTTLRIYRGTISGTLLASYSFTYAGGWRYFALKVTLADSGGRAVLQMGEVGGLTPVTVIDFTGDTKNGGTASVLNWYTLYFGAGGVGLGPIDDVLCMNGAGSANTDFAGDCTIESSKPDGNGNSSVGVGSDGNSTNNYDLVNDGDDDAGYIDFAATGDKDTYTFQNSAYASPSTILGIATYARAKKTDTGARSLAIVARAGGTEVDSADKTLTNTEFRWRKHVYETKPGGGNWGFSDFNGAEFGVKARP